MTISDFQTGDIVRIRHLTEPLGTVCRYHEETGEVIVIVGCKPDEWIQMPADVLTLYEDQQRCESCWSGTGVHRDWCLTVSRSTSSSSDDMRTCPFCGSGEDIDETRCSSCERTMPPVRSRAFSKRTEIPLTPEDQRAVADAILDPPEPGEKLKEAVEHYRETVQGVPPNRADRFRLDPITTDMTSSRAPADDDEERLVNLVTTLEAEVDAHLRDMTVPSEDPDPNRIEEATSALVWKLSPDCFVLDVSEGRLRDRSFGLSHSHSPVYFGMEPPVSDGLWRWNGVVTWDRNRPEPLDVNGRYEPPLWTGTVTGTTGSQTPEDDKAPMEPINYDDLDPGIRHTVRWLRDAGFDTVDSGDGVTKTDDIAVGCALDGAHVFIQVDPSKLAQEAHRLMDLASSEGFKIAGRSLDASLSTVVIEASYSPVDERAILTLTGCPLVTNDESESGSQGP